MIFIYPPIFYLADMRHKYLIQIYSTGVEDRILEDLIQSLKTTFNAKLSLNYLEWKDIIL